jgi:hypothetical protein
LAATIFMLGLPFRLLLLRRWSEEARQLLEFTLQRALPGNACRNNFRWQAAGRVLRKNREILSAPIATR